ncbi:MAG: ParB/RepB/Spo0J family partition protein [Bacteroidetes bacterium]|nr:ParB/RepB/Spo0J family partition protein [Bacteroidota bacterium]
MGKNKKVQNAQQASFSILSLSLIDRSVYNPRKTFNENDLQELAKSIKEKGVIQPIVVRPVGERYEVVCGERRYRASLIAEIGTIPACIRELNDEEAEEVAITENLQRKDVLPMEEARAFHRLVESKKYDIAALVLKFGKSDAFIRSRIKLVLLIDPFKELLEQEEINLGIANVLANYSKEIQEETYNDHFEENVAHYYSWRRKRPTELIDAIESAYSTSLDKYSFDKEECKNCPFNTANFQLFDNDTQGKCTQKACLNEKNKNYVMEEALKLQSENPSLSFCVGKWGSGNEQVIEELKGVGNEISEFRLVELNSDPEMPERSDYEEEEEFAEAMEEYRDELQEFENEKKEFERQIEQGEIIPFIQIGRTDAQLAYAKKDEIEETLQGNSDGDTNSSKLEAARLENKKLRNEELCGEKIRENLKKALKEIEITGEDISHLEETLMYFFMLKNIRTETLQLLGLNKDSWRIEYTDLLELTDEQKTIITRDFLIRNLNEMWITSTKIKESNGLRDFMNQHVSEVVKEIDREQTETYQKKNDRLTERIQALVEEKK